MKKNLAAFFLIGLAAQVFAYQPGEVKWVMQLHAPTVASATLSADENTLYPKRLKTIPKAFEN